MNDKAVLQVLHFTRSVHFSGEKSHVLVQCTVKYSNFDLKLPVHLIKHQAMKVYIRLSGGVNPRIFNLDSRWR
jgi:hypothetical protein